MEFVRPPAAAPARLRQVMARDASGSLLAVVAPPSSTRVVQYARDIRALLAQFEKDSAHVLRPFHELGEGGVVFDGVGLE